MLHSAFIRFHQLPNDLKRAVTSPQAMQQLDGLETTYHVPLADIVVRLMVKEVTLEGLPAFLQKNHSLSADAAAALSRDLQASVLKPVLPYLTGLGAQPTPVRSTTPAPAAVPPQLRNTIPIMAPKAPAPLPKSPAAVPNQPSVRPKLPPQHYSRIASGKAAYYVFAEDEEEIAKHRDRLERLGGVSPTAQIADRVEAIITKFGLTFADDLLAKRFRGLLLSRLRDVRSSEELKELLQRTVKIGGMGYDEARSTSIAAEADAIARTLHDRTEAAHLAKPQPAAVPPPITPAPSPTPPPPSPPPPPVAKPAPPPPRPAAKPTVIPMTNPAATTMRPIFTEPSMVAPAPLRRPVVVPQVGGRMIQDVRRPQRPVSLVEELGMLSLDDFRELGGNLQECVAKVIEKVQLLAEDSYEKRAAGIAAWRKSDVHQLYLAMGRESMVGNKSIEEVMSDRRRQQMPYLTAMEFAAIADLNHQLMP